VFPSGLLTNTLYAFLFSLIHAICPATSSFFFKCVIERCCQLLRLCKGQSESNASYFFYLLTSLLMGIAAISVQFLNFIDHLLLVPTVSFNRWQHHS
jgi:hypothetical protein